MTAVCYVGLCGSLKKTVHMFRRKFGIVDIVLYGKINYMHILFTLATVDMLTNQ